MKGRIIQRVWLSADTRSGLVEEVNKAIKKQGLEPVGDPVFEDGSYHQELVNREREDASEERLDRSALDVDGTMKLVATHRGVEAHRFAQEPLPYGAGWPEMADVAATIHIYELKPHEVYRPHYYLLLAYDAEGNRVGRKELGDGEWEE